MRKLAVTLLLAILCLSAHTQQQKTIDSLKKLIATAKDDTTRVMQMSRLSAAYIYSKPDSALALANDMLRISKAAQDRKNEGRSLNSLGNVYMITGNYSKALTYMLSALKVDEQIGYRRGIASTLGNMGLIYAAEGDHRKAIAYFLQAKAIIKNVHNQRGMITVILNLGDSYEKLNILDSALWYTRQAVPLSLDFKDGDLIGVAYNNLGNIYLKMKHLDTALYYYRKGMPLIKLAADDDAWGETSIGMAKIFQKKEQPDSALYYGRQSIAAGWRGGFTDGVLVASTFLTEYFEKQGRLDSAFLYQKVLIAAKDSLYSKEKTKEFQNLSFAEHQRQQEIQEKDAAYRTRIRFYLMMAVVVFFVILAFVFWRNNRQKQRVNLLLTEQKEEIEIQRDNLEGKKRDLEIEAALEKVRSCSLAMHKSDELDQVVAVVADKLRELGVVMEGAVICTPANEGQGMMMWSAMAAHMNAPPLYVPLGHSLINEWGYAWKSGADYMGKVWTYEEKVDFWEWAFEHSDFKHLPEFRKEQIRQGTGYALSAAFQKNSSIAIPSHTGQILSETHAEILKRFSKVFEQAYIRFLDLKKAEAQAKEAEIQLALERVRARTMAMQHSSELKDAASILFQQVELLGVTTWTSGFQLWEEYRKAVTVWTCTAGVVQQAFRLPADDDRDSFMMQVINADQNGEDLYVEELSGKVLEDHYSYMAELPGLADNFKSLSDAGIVLPLSQVNHAAFFSYGYLLFITYEPMPQAHDIFKRFAKVFDQTYTRFLDLQKSEALALRAKEDLVLLQTEKKRAEDALTELKVTQAQLVQREKMASLGELTAGIAHEIQNPLNFVNNFSEVSAELIDEMEEELAKGDTEEARAIAADVKQNLEKIRHHGKRADGIVKGMLEHSRVGSGQKQLVDLNVLADEFLKLSYHGLRAKDKSFNADLVTHYDEGLPQINIIPQDMGRVLLNLFNNAFYAVNQKSKAAGADYKPEVSVSTSAENGQIILKVKDNGTGMPDAIKEKIMQPFFTTKPTGEGTGLGLSLSYDIVVKGHGGIIQIESTEGQGSEFIIILHNQI